MVQTDEATILLKVFKYFRMKIYDVVILTEHRYTNKKNANNVYQEGQLVQDDFGGSVKMYSPTDEEIIFAENTAKACVELPIYSRVDIFTDNDKKIALSELELIEPELWFRFFPQAAKTLASDIKNRLEAL